MREHTFINWQIITRRFDDFICHSMDRCDTSLAKPQLNSSTFAVRRIVWTSELSELDHPLVILACYQVKKERNEVALGSKFNSAVVDPGQLGFISLWLLLPSLGMIPPEPSMPRILKFEIGYQEVCIDLIWAQKGNSLNWRFIIF